MTMKLLYLTKAVLFAHAQTPCENNFDCNFVIQDKVGAYWDGGCCNRWESVEWGDKENQGKFGENWKQFTGTEELKVGTGFQLCMPASYVKKTAEDMDANGGFVNNFADLTAYAAVTPGFLLKDPEGDPNGDKYADIGEMIVGNGSTVEAQKSFKLKSGCIKPTPTDENPLGITKCAPGKGAHQDGCGGDGDMKDTCCNVWTAVSFMDDIKMGVFGQNWKFYAGKGLEITDFEAGQSFSACVPKTYVAASEASAPTGETNNFDDLKAFVTGLGLGDGDSEFELGGTKYANVEAWVEAWGSSKADQEGFKMTVGCNMAEKLALSGMMAIGSMLAIM